MLSSLQQRIARIVGGTIEGDDFALAGGGALVSRGEVDRLTQDLDFFGLAPESVDRVSPLVQEALSRAGLEIGVVREAHGFVRLSVSDGNERTEVDLAADARLFPAEQGPVVRTLAVEELAVDKVLAIFGRAEARDFIDLQALEPRYGLARLFQLAAEKDRGFRSEVFREMLGRFQRLARQEFQLDSKGYGALAATVEKWRVHALDIGREAGPDMGIGL
ncbi:MAG: nucleotidyl transferase AbiEii/AbiGii toxin family protein [Acidimicrobiales bacterium]